MDLEHKVHRKSTYQTKFDGLFWVCKCDSGTNLRFVEVQSTLTKELLEVQI